MTTGELSTATIATSRRVAVTPLVSRLCAGRRNRWPRTGCESLVLPKSGSSQPGYTRITAIHVQPASFGELGGGARDLALEAVGSGKRGMNRLKSRIDAARLFEPNDRLVGVRLQHMDSADPDVPIDEGGIAWAETNRPLDKRDRLLDRPSQELALAEREHRVHPIAIRRERRLVFEDGLPGLPPRTQQLGFGEMRKWETRRCRERLSDQPVRSEERRVG